MSDNPFDVFMTTPLPSLPPNCHYLELWSFYERLTTAGEPVEPDDPWNYSYSFEAPLDQYQTYLFPPPENVSFATADCGNAFENPCIVPVGKPRPGKAPVGKLIRNSLVSPEFDTCSNEDFGFASNTMVFLDPITNTDLDIVQYQSSLATSEFHASTKKKGQPCAGGGFYKDYTRAIAAYPITGGTGSYLAASGSVAVAKTVHVELGNDLLDLYDAYQYTICTPPPVPPVPPVPKSPKNGKGTRR